MRIDKREFNEIREIKVTPLFLPSIPNNLLISMGNTRVICAATLEKGVPGWLKGQGKGWVTAEYGMLPKSSVERIKRERKNISGRTQEIQRLIGRSLRAGIDLTKLGERQITIDCDVIEADGGTRTASITGGFIALSMLILEMVKKREIENPIKENICAISAGIIEGTARMDLNYIEDSTAEVDMNIVMNKNMKLVEIQGTGEGKTFSKEEFLEILDLTNKIIPKIVKIQDDAINEWKRLTAY